MLSLISVLQRSLGALGMIATACVTQAIAQVQRPMTVDDLFALEQLGSVSVSPDGKWLAVVIGRASNGREPYRDLPGLQYHHADVWLLRSSGGERRNITNGSADGAGYWSPVWSPDSKRLAMLAVGPGSTVQPFVWEMATDRLVRVSDRGVDLGFSGDEGWPMAPLMWSNSTTLVCPLRPKAAPQSPAEMTTIASYRVAIGEWEKAERGEEATANVLKSGPGAPLATRASAQLVAIDVTSGRTRTVAEGGFKRLLLSPTRGDIAIITQTYAKRPAHMGPRLKAYTDGSDTWWHTRLALASLAAQPRVSWVEGVGEPRLSLLTMVFGETPHEWSPDGASFAFVGMDSTGREAATHAVVVSAGPGLARRVTTSSLEVLRTTWSSGGQLLVLARARSASAEQGDSSRVDWWLVDPHAPEAPTKLTGGLKDVPTELYRTVDHRVMLGLAAGEMWSINTQNAATVNLTRSIRREIESVVSPSLAQRTWRGRRVFVVRTKDQALLRLDWNSGALRATSLPSPSPEATLVADRVEDGLLVYTEETGNGTSLWTGDATTGRLQRRFIINQQVQQIADARSMMIEYRGADGDSLNALLLVPPNDESKARYPLVSVVYGGQVIRGPALGDFVQGYASKQSAFFLNLNLLVARGYAVLVPSIPLKAEGAASDPYLDLPKGVLPAIDRVIELGIADPQRLAVMGHSYGGYSALSLVTYTDRFKAAIALAAPTDLAAYYFTLWPSMRYDANPLGDLFFQALSESGQMRMGGPPWTDMERYLRNSPISFVDRVRTPVMLIQGDMDYVPMAQGEQLFAALYRLGKASQFIRYWGEGHLLSSPANIRDMWQRVFAWLDEHVAKPGVGTAPAVEALSPGDKP